MSRHTWLLCALVAIVGMGCSMAGECDQKFQEAIKVALDAPSLSSVEIYYSWTKGYGRGEVEAVIRSDGESVLTLRAWKQDPEVHRAQIPAARVRGILQHVGDAHVECMVTRERSRCAADLGKYTLRIAVPGSTREVYYDGAHYLTQPSKMGIGTVFDDIYSLSKDFGAPLDWAAYGLAWVKCPAK